MASTADSMVPYAVMTMTWVSGEERWMASRSCMPSMLGMRRSVRTTSYGPSPRASRALVPSAASATRCPAWRRRSAVVARMFF